MAPVSAEHCAVRIAPGRKLRCLALHSWRTSGSIFQKQLVRAKLQDNLSDLLDIVFIDAPHLASGLIPDDVAPYFEGPYYEWVTAEETPVGVEFDLKKITTSHHFIVETMRKHGPFDCVMGFSQGSVLSAALVAMQLAGKMPADIPPLKCCILFAGMKSRYSAHAAAMVNSITLPSLHIWGEKDFLRKHCEDLAEAFLNPVVLLHKRGHVIPLLEGSQLLVMRAFLASFLPSSAPSKL